MSDLADWLQTCLGVQPKDRTLYIRALTHGSHGGATYERLEFLGDRVLGLVIADWLYAEFPDEPEGKLSVRYNALVSRISCARIGKELGVVPHIRLGKQARDDGASGSDNVIGDVVEALIGALFLEHGLSAAQALVRRAWGTLMEPDALAALHPKSALQEWAAAHNRKPPVYTVTDRSGPDHNPSFTVTVSLGSAGEATAQGRSKQEAQSAAAAALLKAVSA